MNVSFFEFGIVCFYILRPLFEFSAAELHIFLLNDQFKILLSNKNEHYKLKKLAVTLDTKEDFLRIKNIYSIIKNIKINKQPSLTINLFKKKLFF